MNTHYKANDMRHTLAAIVCTVLFGSVALAGAVGPAGALAPVAHAVSFNA